MRSILLLLLLLPTVARAAAPDEVAQTLADVLVHDDLPFTTERLASGRRDPRALIDLVELVDLHDCIVVARHEWAVVNETPDAVTLRVQLAGTGTLKGRTRRVVSLPTTWHVEAKREGDRWKLASAKTEERRVAETMIAAPSLREAEVLFLASSDPDPLDVIEKYADLLEAATALDRLPHAVALAQASGDASTEAFARRMIAKAALRGKAPERALEQVPYLEALAAHPSPDVRAEALFSAGLANLHGGRNEEALVAYLAGGDLVHEVDEPLRTLKSLYMYYWLAASIGRMTPALHASQRVAELAREYRWEEGEVSAIFIAAQIQDDLRNFEYARDGYLLAARAARERGRTDFLTTALYNVGRMEQALGNYDRADEALRSVVAGALPEHARSMYSLLARIAILDDRLEDAERYLRRGEELNVTGSLGINTIPIYRAQILLRAGKPREALEALQRSAPDVLHPAEDSATMVTQTTILRTGAEALVALGRCDEAIERLREAVARVDDHAWRIVTTAAKAVVMTDVRPAYVQLVELLVERGEDAEALRVAERMRAGVLRDLIARGHVDLSGTISDRERAREAELEQRVVGLNRELAKVLTEGAPGAALREQIASARRELDAFRDELRVAHPDVARRRVESHDVLDLPRGVDAVEYVVAEKQTVAFVVTRGRVRAFRLPVSRKDVQREAGRVATEVASRSLTFRTPARKLYAMLVAPLEKELGGRTLCIIPDVELWSVPFQALIDGSGKYVADRHTLFYAHSLSLAHQEAPPETNRPALLAFGNPAIAANTRGTVASAFRDVTLGSLEDAEAEVRSVASMYGEERSRVYVREAAREAVFKREAPAFRVIHIAAHAIVDDRAPMYSSIVLAAGHDERDQDGLLEAREVVDLPLQADLAVLSACDTARGRIGEGEGVIGLAWAFFAAGCPSTVVSQWKAETKATARLMVTLHERLQAGDSPAAALRAAQTALRRDPKYRHPFFWAPFVAIGAAGS